MLRQIPGLGQVSGIYAAGFDDVEQYNGLPYGEVSARFAPASLVKTWPNGQWDGTIYGPICPFPKMVIGMGLTQQKLPPQHDYVMDEFKCLNLNITCPKGSTPGDDLPVIVWVHGGGNCVGSGSDSGYNGAPLVSFAQEQSLPTVVVTINYRLGAFGFLASSDIRSDNQASGSSGVGNYGLRDILLAFEWVKTNIKAFGGNPHNVTAAGQSAGSIDLHLLMCSELFPSAKPFNQVILASGVASLTVRSLKHQQVIYDKIAARLGVQEHHTARERLKALRGVPADELVNSYVALGAPVVSWQATVDGVFLKQTPSVSNLPFQKYDPGLRRVLIGDCAHEGTIFAFPLKAMQFDYPKLQQMASSLLGDEASKELLQEYGISASSSPEDLFTRLTLLDTDAEWSHPIQTVARSFSEQDVFYYHIRDVNPFPGPNKGLSHHGVDLLYIFLTYQSYLPDNPAKLAKAFAKSWLVFANGGTPWKSYDKTQDGKSIIMYFGPNGVNTEGSEESKMAYKGLQVCEKLLLKHPYFVASLRGENIVE